MKRLNVKLALSLVIITLVSVVGVHFLHGYQLGRNADVLRIQAEKAEADKDIKGAIKQYNQYLKHRDDPKGYEALAGLVVSLAGENDATRQDKMRAYNILEEAIRRHPDLHTVRKQLVDYTMKMHRYPEALEHLKHLLEGGVKDPTLDVQVAQCHNFNGEEDKALKKLDEITGYNEQTGAFVAEPPAGAKEVKAFELLAQILARKTDGKAKAEAVMAQLVAWNPDSAKAHLSRASFLFANNPRFQADDNGQPIRDDAGQMKETEAFALAKAELDRAFELDADDAEVMLARAVFLMGQHDLARLQKDPDQAKQYLDQAKVLLNQALKEYPDRQDVYLRLAQVSVGENNPKQAIEQLEEGLKKATETPAILERLADLEFQQNDFDAVRRMLGLMQERNFIPEFLRYQEARLKVAEGEYSEGSRELEAVRPAIVRFANSAYLQQLDTLLGRCYEALGQPDRQYEVYRRLLQAQPDSLMARVGQAIALQALGKFEEAEQDLSLLAPAAPQYPFIQATLLQMLINNQTHKPEEKRDWTEVEKVAELMYADPTRKELDNTLLKADLLMARGDLKETQRLLNGARQTEPKDPRVWAGLIRLLTRQERTASMPALIKFAEKELGDTVPLRAEKSRVIVRARGEKAPQEIAQLEKGKFNETEQNQLLLQLGNSYMQIGDYKDAKRCWKAVAEKDLRNANLRQIMFELAVDNKDLVGMQEVVDEIRDSRYLGPQTSLYKYCAATAKLWPVNQKRGEGKALDDEDRKKLAQARKLIDEGIAGRGEWSVLWRVRGELDQLEGNIDGAIADYQRALDYNRNNQAVTGRRLVQLLYQTRRFMEANEALKFVGDQSQMPEIWKHTIEDIKFRSGEVDAAIETARRDAEKNPENPSAQVWLAQLLLKAGKTDEAEAALRQAVVAGPKLADTWNYLIRHLMANKKKAEAVEAVREAAKNFPDDELLLAQFYDQVDDRDQAEHFFSLALEKQPGSPTVLRKIADHYFQSKQADKAMPYLDQMIEKTNPASEKTPADQQLAVAQVAWARRIKAQMVAAPGDYEHALEATKLIEQNAVNGKLADEDAVVIAQLLANRNDIESRKKATGLLELIQSRHPLNPRQQLALGQLYERGGKWEKAQELLLSAIARNGDDAEALTVLVDLLVRHGSYEDATRWMDRLEEVLAKSPVPASELVRNSTTELKAQLLAKSGHPDQAVAVLERMLPRPLPQSKLYQLEEVAKQMEIIEQFEPAEKLLNEYISLEPRGIIAMAAYLGRRGDLDKSFAMLDESRKNQPVAEVLICAMESLRKHPEKFTQARFKILEDWANAGLQTDADSQQVKLLLAELYDYEGKYPEVIKLYREVLASDKANLAQKIITRNNLAFVLAITKESPAEAMQLINDAVNLLGPTSDLLDTRALAYSGQGDTKRAIADLKVAIVDNPTDTKYLHLAQIEKQANNLDGARAALAKAQELGVETKWITPLERKTYNQLKDELK